MSEQSPWLTKSEAAHYLRVTTRTIDQWVLAGRITRHHVDGTRYVRFSRKELAELVVRAS